MKIDAVGVDYHINKTGKNDLTKVKNSKFKKSVGMSLITFKGGDVRQIGHVISEEPLFGISGGGVGTVSHDYNLLCKDRDKVIKFLPIHNQQVLYKEDLDPVTGKVRGTLPQEIKMRYIPNNLPEGHPFKGMEGTPFFTMEKIDNSTDIVKLLKDKKDKIFLFDEVKSSTMQWGREEKVPIKMFKARKTDALIKAMNNKNIAKENQDKLEFVFTFVDSTASMTKPYQDGAYSTKTGSELEKMFSQGWEGSPYAKLSKAEVELMPALKEKFGLNPKYIICSDGQTMYIPHFAAQKAAAGDAFWQETLAGVVGHNMNQGYTQPMGARQAIVNLGATKKDIEKIMSSEKYIEALKLNREEDFLRETVLKNFYNKEIGELNAFLIPMHYAKAGFVPMITTVSEGYHDEIISNELLSPMSRQLAELDKLGRFKGLTNPLMDPVVSGFVYDGLNKGYSQDSKIKLTDGKEVVVPKFKIFDIAKKYDLKHIRSIKQENKLNLLERFSSKYVGSQLYDEKNNVWKASGSGQWNIVTGKPDKEVNIYGKISDTYVQKLKKGEDVKLIVSWGRGDFQKAMDTVIDSFEKYAQKDPNAILIMGGPMENEEALATVEKFKMKMNQPGLQGRMIFMDGWAPGKEFSLAGDVALLPSRFAPCELTDLEAKKYCCTPIVPNAQGMAQKNFDPSIANEAAKMDAYKGKHSYFMSEEVALGAANKTEKANFIKGKEKIVKELKNKYKGQVNKDIPEELLNKQLNANDKYQKLLRKLRDSVISDEMAECLERALIKDRNTSVAEKILKNQVDADTTWFGNAWLSATGKSSGQLYSEYHFDNRNGGKITKDQLIKLDFSDLGASIDGKYRGGKNKLVQFFKSKGGKWAVGGTALAAVAAGIGYYGHKEGWFASNNKNYENPQEHLSCVG